MHSLSSWLRAVWREALRPPDRPPETPGPLPTSSALHDGALLFERAGEPITVKRVA
jgi:hypothetical protein